MNAETLEVLLIDRALGQLSPEVEVLLAEHLAANPAAARTAAELAETVALAAAVLKTPARALPLPPSRVVFLPGRRVSRGLALAASFAIGVAVAWLTLRTPVPPRETPPVVAATPAPPRETSPAVRALPFWSKERALASAASTSTR